MNVAIDSSGNIYVADLVNDRLKKHNSAGTYVTSITGLDAPVGVCIDSSDNIYVSVFDGFARGIRKYNSALSLQWSLVDSTLARYMATDGTHLYYTTYTEQVWKVSCSTGSLISSFGSAGTGDGQFDTPEGIATDGTYLYVVDAGNDRIQKFTTSGAYISQWGRSGSDPGEFQAAVGIHYNSVTGFLYVTDSGRDDVQEFTTDGAFVGSFGAAGTGNGQFQNASGIASDVAGDSVWVADATQDRLQKFTRSVTSEEATRVAFNPNDFIVSSTDGGETGFISFIRAVDVPDHAHTESGDGGALIAIAHDAVSHNVASNSSTVTWATHISTTKTLPAGTWDCTVAMNANYTGRHASVLPMPELPVAVRLLWRESGLVLVVPPAAAWCPMDRRRPRSPGSFVS